MVGTVTRVFGLWILSCNSFITIILKIGDCKEFVHMPKMQVHALDSSTFVLGKRTSRTETKIIPFTTSLKPQTSVFISNCSVFASLIFSPADDSIRLSVTDISFNYQQKKKRYIFQLGEGNPNFDRYNMKAKSM